MVDQFRVKTPDPFVSNRSTPIPHLRVNATSSGSADTLLTVRERATLVVKHFAAVNTTGSAATLTVHSIPSGDSIGLDNAELVAVNIPANTAANLTDFVGQLYASGTVLKAYSDTADAIVLHGWAEEIL